MSELWVPDKTVKKWVIPRRPVGNGDIQVMGCGHFQTKYDKVSLMLDQFGCMDELISGM